MGHRVKKGLAILMVLIVFLIGMLCTLSVKRTTIDAVYAENNRLQLAFSAGQYVSRIEYALRYGKQLEAYYNMDSLLERLRQTSSYMEGVCVVSADGKLCGQAGRFDGRILDPASLPEAAGLYASLDTMDGAWLWLDIEGREGLAGWMLLRLNRAALNTEVEQEKQSAALQSLVIWLEAASVVTLVIMRAKEKRRPRAALRFCVLVCVFILAAQAVDLGLETVQAGWRTESMARRSAHQVVQTIQEEVNSVIAKGARPDSLTDLNSYLRKTEGNIEVIRTLYSDQNAMIYGQHSSEYVSRRTRGYAARAAATAGVTLGCCTAVCLAAGLAPAAIRRCGKKKVMA